MQLYQLGFVIQQIERGWTAVLKQEDHLFRARRKIGDPFGQWIEWLDRILIWSSGLQLVRKQP